LQKAAVPAKAFRTGVAGYAGKARIYINQRMPGFVASVMVMPSRVFSTAFDKTFTIAGACIRVVKDFRILKTSRLLNAMYKKRE
jgi:hypothetical protein